VPIEKVDNETFVKKNGIKLNCCMGKGDVRSRILVAQISDTRTDGEDIGQYLPLWGYLFVRKLFKMKLDMDSMLQSMIFPQIYTKFKYYV
jgi:hypothetical protein